MDEVGVIKGLRASGCIVCLFVHLIYGSNRLWWRIFECPARLKWPRYLKATERQNTYLSKYYVHVIWAAADNGSVLVLTNNRESECLETDSVWSAAAGPSLHQLLGSGTEALHFRCNYDLKNSRKKVSHNHSYARGGVCVCVFFKCVPSRDKKTRALFIVFSITQTLHLYFWLLDQKQSFVNVYICFNKVRWKNVEFYLPCKLLPRVRWRRVTEVDSNKGFSSVNLKKKKKISVNWLTDWLTEEAVTERLLRALMWSWWFSLCTLVWWLLFHVFSQILSWVYNWARAAPFSMTLIKYSFGSVF